MRTIMRVIARLLGLQTQSTDNPVQPTQAAGPAPQARIRKAGNKHSAPTTKPRRPSKSVTAKPSSKVSAAPSTKAGSSRKAEPKSAPAALGQSGKQPVTAALPTRQPAKPALTKKPKAAVLISRVKKATSNKTAAQTRTALPSRANGA